MRALLLGSVLVAGASWAGDGGGAIQQRAMLRAFRLELAPSFAVSVNDPFFTRLGGALRVAFHVTETLAVSVRGAYFASVPTEDVVVAKRQFGHLVKPASPWLAMADVEWAPAFGKFTVAESILHFDVFAVAGFGVAVARPAFDFGGGVRLTLRQAVSFNVAMIDTAYVERAGVQNVLMAYAGLSVLLPFSSGAQP